MALSTSCSSSDQDIFALIQVLVIGRLPADAWLKFDQDFNLFAQWLLVGGT
ncbi:hypothetical protein SAMN05661012_06758 [Chitinophaga sancti]|uniref:Uncharacterized protein n=1 Tax=Chitinophaga sancti TaxID=1004 RepID=A0A1K1T4K2_9BACT|nr:hypothetical protein SAMN05661012_06758 [Chitinophaga sancti]